MRKKIGAALIGIGITAASVLMTSGSASSHGYTDSPISRQKVCQSGGAPTACGPIQYEPQSVEGPKGFPGAGPADGKLCAGGNAQFAQLDDPRGGGWPTTRVTGGQSYTFSWRFTAMHATTDFKYYITKNGYSPSQPITRANLELTPFFAVPFNGQRPPSTLTHTGQIPAGKSGHHVILAVWTIADTPNAFYACSDVQF